jgi:hypothetical protein
MSKYLFIDEDGVAFFSDKFEKIDVCCVYSGQLQIIDVNTEKYMEVIDPDYDNNMENQKVKWGEAYKGCTKVDSEGNGYTTYIEG